MTQGAGSRTPRLAILQYVVMRDCTYVLLLKLGFDQPLVYEARDESSGLRRESLELCAARLLIDFHGLPPNWDLDAEPRLRDALGLSPVLSPAKRNKAVLERTLANPSFHYEIDYWTQLGSRLLPAPLRPRLEDCDLLCIIPHGPLTVCRSRPCPRPRTSCSSNSLACATLQA